MFIRGHTNFSHASRSAFFVVLHFSAFCSPAFSSGANLAPPLKFHQNLRLRCVSKTSNIHDIFNSNLNKDCQILIFLITIFLAQMAIIRLTIV